MNPSANTYRVKKAIRAVRFTHESGGSGTIVTIPEGAVIRVHGAGVSANFLQVEWVSELYSVLCDDLESCAENL